MTAPGTRMPSREGSSVLADRPRVLVLWSLLIVGLLAAVPCAGTARAVGSAHALPTARLLPSPDTRPEHRVSGTVRTDAPADTDTLAGAARADRSGRDGHGHHALAAVDRGGLPSIWCAEGERPAPGSGCSSHAFCGPDSQLPNAPPQPGAVALPQLVGPAALPGGPQFGVLAGPDHAPDLHVLQVFRS